MFSFNSYFSTVDLYSCFLSTHIFQRLICIHVFFQLISFNGWFVFMFSFNSYFSTVDLYSCFLSTHIFQRLICIHVFFQLISFNGWFVFMFSFNSYLSTVDLYSCFLSTHIFQRLICIRVFFQLISFNGWFVFMFSFNSYLSTVDLYSCFLSTHIFQRLICIHVFFQLISFNGWFVFVFFQLISFNGWFAFVFFQLISFNGWFAFVFFQLISLNGWFAFVLFQLISFNGWFAFVFFQLISFNGWFAFVFRIIISPMDYFLKFGYFSIISEFFYEYYDTLNYIFLNPEFPLDKFTNWKHLTTLWLNKFKPSPNIINFMIFFTAVNEFNCFNPMVYPKCVSTIFIWYLCWMFLARESGRILSLWPIFLLVTIIRFIASLLLFINKWISPTFIVRFGILSNFFSYRMVPTKFVYVDSFLYLYPVISFNNNGLFFYLFLNILSNIDILLNCYLTSHNVLELTVRIFKDWAKYWIFILL